MILQKNYSFDDIRVDDGIQNGEFKEDLDQDALASFAFTLLEGGIMLSKLEGDNRFMKMNMASFSAYLQQVCMKIH
ncbi:TetR family transcriptional regulator C-terminal domain-containing protein [Paenibacillus cremeus]|uniref:TetR family transcriptional regulator C-terminal domain-containing protein n=1 Tax=Paenibacillus cremeus TaxID=2163881 RepID=UPI0037041890